MLICLFIQYNSIIFVETIKNNSIMSILVGIKVEKIQVSPSYGSEGFGGGYSGTFNNVDVIKEGTHEELELYVKEKRDDVVKGIELFKTIDNDLLEFNEMTEEEFYKIQSKARKLVQFREYKKLLILEGKIV